MSPGLLALYYLLHLVWITLIWRRCPTVQTQLCQERPSVPWLIFLFFGLDTLMTMLLSEFYFQIKRSISLFFSENVDNSH